MGQAHLQARNPAPRGELRRLAVQTNQRRPAPLPRHFDLLPSRMPIPAGAKRLHRRLLGGKPRRVALVTRAPASFAISPFASGEDAPPKPLARNRVAERSRDPLDFDYVNPRTDNRHDLLR